MTNSNQNSVGKKIKAYRQAQKITQEQLAEKLFVAKSTISKWESGVAEPDIKTLQNITNIFKVDIGSFLSNDVSPSENDKQDNLSSRKVTSTGTNHPTIYSTTGQFSNLATIQKNSGGRAIWITIYLAIAIGLAITIALMLKTFSYIDFIILPVLFIALVIVMISHRFSRNRKSKFGQVENNAKIKVSKKALLIEMIEQEIVHQYLWSNVVNISQRSELTNKSRIGWSWLTGFNTVNKVGNELSPILIQFDDGQNFVLNDRSKQTVDLLRTLNS